MIQTRYSDIKSRNKVLDIETYKGVWNNSPCEFKRDFRGHRLTDEECAGLCRGEKIEIHNLQNKYASVYAVSCKLNIKENIFGELGTVIDVLDTVPNNPNHKYGDKLYNANPYTIPVTINPNDDDLELILNDDDLNGIDTEDEVLKYRESLYQNVSKIHKENTDIKSLLKSITKSKLEKTDINQESIKDDNHEDESIIDNDLQTKRVDIQKKNIETNLTYNVDDIPY